MPFLIPLSWYATSILAWDLAARLTDSRAARIVTGSVFMVMWDLALDPAMVAAFPVWRWHVDGFFYGMPFVNLVGWFVTSLIILGAYERFVGRLKPVAPSWTYRIWLASAALPVGLAAARGLSLAVVIGSIAVAVPVVVVELKQRVGFAAMRTVRP